jgi:hypothetical protein
MKHIDIGAAKFCDRYPSKNDRLSAGVEFSCKDAISRVNLKQLALSYGLCAKPGASSFFPPVERTDPETPPDHYFESRPD